MKKEFSFKEKINQIPQHMKDDFTYISNYLSKEESEKLFEYLLSNCHWEEREVTIFNKTYKQPRLICWFGKNDYTYSNEIFRSKKMPLILEKLKEKIELEFGYKFNSALINLYRNENDSMGRHSDDEKELGKNPVIASISLGEKRIFKIQNKISKEIVKLEPSNGSLLIMKNYSQKLYTHEVPKTNKEKNKRINITFRFIYEKEN